MSKLTKILLHDYWPWLTVKALAETAVLTRASLTVLILVPILNAVWSKIPEILKTPELFGPKLPFDWIIIYVAALIVALCQAAYQVLAPGLVREYSPQQHLDENMDSFRRSPDYKVLKREMLNQSVPQKEQIEKWQDAVFLAGNTKDPNYLNEFFQVLGPNTDKQLLSDGQKQIRYINPDYQRTIAISNDVMPKVFQLEYETAASTRYKIAMTLRTAYVLAIFLVLYVILTQSLEIFIDQLPDTSDSTPDLKKNLSHN